MIAANGVARYPITGNHADYGVEAMRFYNIGRFTVAWKWRKRPLRPTAIEPLRLPRDHIELALGLTAIALAGVIGAMPLVVWLLTE